jgi:hypothetical protein
MYAIAQIKKINATAHPFNREAAETGLHPDDKERIAVLRATSAREAKDATAALASV